MKRSLSVLFLFFTLTAFAQTGTISGTVTEKLPGKMPEAVIGAVVFIDSTGHGRVGTTTDFDGKYVLRIAPGTYSVTCKYLGYPPLTVTGVKVAAGKTTPLDFPFDASQTLDSGNVIVIYADRPTGSMAAVLDTLHNSNNIGVGKGQAEIARSGAQTAGEVAKTLPGVTLVDNRFVIVRGLSERYNAVLLNNAPAPSVESDVKAFSFDLVPGSMIDNFIIFQSPSPDLPGEFSGGAIRISTTDIPDHSGFNIQYTAGYRNGTTFSPFSLNRGTSSDLYACGAGSRALPADFPVNLRPLAASGDYHSIEAAGRSLSNDWSYTTRNAPVDNKFNLTWNYRFSSQPPKGHAGFQFGNITGLSYSNTYASCTSYRLDYNTYDTINRHSDTIFAYTDNIFRNSTRVAFIQNNAIRFGKAGTQRITFKNLFNRMGDNETVLRMGRNMEESNYRKEYSYRYTQRTIYTGQLGGQHSFHHKRTQFDWTAAYAFSRREDPDWRKARYTKDFSAAPSDSFSLYIPGTSNPSPAFLGRIFIDMNERILTGAGNVTQTIILGKDSASTGRKGYRFTVKAGVYMERKDRAFHIRNLGYVGASVQTFGNYTLLHTPVDQIFAPENINTTNGLKIAEDTKKSDQYIASNELQAGYVMAALPFGSFTGRTDQRTHERIRVSGGLRVEHNIQELHSNKTNSSDTVIVKNDLLTPLPSLNIAYNFSERMLVRGAYGKTINRPEFREIAPMYFYDFIFNAIYTGNDSLKTPQIDNYDLRWEFYPRPGENISVGFFYKKFVNPIEMYFLAMGGTGGTRGFTWGNAPAARNWGVEVEVRKKFDSLDVPVLRNLGFVGNAAWIHSAINLSSTENNSESQRPMMGQSPWIVNAGLYYQDDSLGLQVNVNYNIIGPRVVIVGIPGVPEVYEMPRHQLDLSFVQSVGKNRRLDLRLSIFDVLNQETLLMQDANGDGKLDRKTDQRMQYYRRGTYFTLGAAWRI